MKFGWTFAEVTRQSAREKLRALALQRWRRPEYVAKFPVKELLAALNVAEGFQPVDPTGGADTVGGSPRGRGSALSPQQTSSNCSRTFSSALASLRLRFLGARSSVISLTFAHLGLPAPRAIG